MPYATRARAAKVDEEVLRDKSKRNKHVMGGAEDTKSSPVGAGGRKVARAVRKMRAYDEEEDNDSLNDFKVPATRPLANRHAKCGSHEELKKGPVVTLPATKGRTRQKAPPPKQPTLMTSSEDEDDDNDVPVPEVRRPKGTSTRSKSKDTKAATGVSKKGRDTTKSTNSSSSNVSTPPGSSRGKGNSRKETVVYSVDSSSMSSVPASPAASTKNVSKTKTRTRSKVISLTEDSEDDMFTPVSPVLRASARLHKKNEGSSSRDSNVSTASTRSTRTTRGKKKAPPEVFLLTTDESEGEKEAAGASAAAAAIATKGGKTSATVTATATGKGKKKEHEVALMPPPPKVTRQLRERSKINSSNDNVSKEVVEEEPEAPRPPVGRIETKPNFLQPSGKSTASGKENATPSKGKTVTFVNAVGENITLNADTFSSQCRNHAKLVQAAAANLVAVFDPAIMKEIKELQEEMRKCAKSSTVPKLSQKLSQDNVQEEQNQPNQVVEDTASFRVDDGEEDLFEEAEKAERDNMIQAVEPPVACPAPTVSEDEIIKPAESQRGSRKRCRSPEIIETTTVGKDQVTFDFQTVAEVQQGPKEVPLTKKLVVEVFRCDEERKSEDKVPESITSSPAALDATFVQESPNIKNNPVVSLDATYIKAPLSPAKDKPHPSNCTYVKNQNAESPTVKALRKSPRNSGKSVASEASQYFDTIQSPLAKIVSVVGVDSDDLENAEFEPSLLLFESPQLVAPSPMSVKKQEPEVPFIPNNDTICLPNPAYLPASALKPPCAALRHGPWLPAASTAGLDALIEEDSQDSVKSSGRTTKENVDEKELQTQLVPADVPGQKRCPDGATSSSSSSSSSSFKSAKCFPSSASGKTIKTNVPPKDTFNFTKKNAIEREREAQKKKDDFLQQRKDMQQKKNEEWAKKAEKIRLEEVKKRDEAGKKLQLEEAARKAKPPLPVFQTKAKILEKNTKPVPTFKLGLGQEGQGLLPKMPVSHVGFTNSGFKASGPMSGFKSATSEQKVAFQPKVKIASGLSTPTSSNFLSVVGGHAHSTEVFKVPDVPLSHYSFLDTTHENSMISSYEITRYEDLDEDLKHRENKHVPEWAQNKEELSAALFKQSLLGEYPSSRTPFPKPDKRFKLFKC